MVGQRPHEVTEDYRHIMDCVREVLTLPGVRIDPAHVLIAGYSVGGSAAPYLASHEDLFTAFAVLHGHVPARGGVADIGLHQFRFKERLAGADPFLRVGLLALLLVGVPGARVADGIDVGERLALAAEIGHHVAERVENRVQAGIVQNLLGEDFPIAELFVQARHADEQRGDFILHAMRPDLFAVAGLAPLLDVILHLGLDFQIASAKQKE